MIRLLYLLISVFLLASTAYSETPQYKDVIMHSARTSTGNGTSLNVHNANTVRLDIQITGTATVAFEIAGPGNFAWYPKLCVASDSTSPVTETSATGVYFCQVAAGNTLQARVSSYTSGAISVVGRASTAF